jgi:hypothetical protein
VSKKGIIKLIFSFTTATERVRIVPLRFRRGRKPDAESVQTVSITYVFKASTQERKEKYLSYKTGKKRDWG